MPTKKARLKDIAHLSGVSIGTVDRVLHARGEVAADTEKKILKIAEELNYTPNLMARALKSKKSYNLVALLPESTPENTFWSKHPAGMTKAMNELEMFPLYLDQLSFDMLNEEDFLEKTKRIINLHPDGVLLAPIFKSESITFCSQLSKARIPFVFIDGFIKETNFLAYIGENVFQSGKVAGQLTDMLTPEKKDILIVNIAKNIQNIHHLNNRMKGFMDYFSNSGKNSGRKIRLNISNTDFENIKISVDKVFIKYPEIASIFITGSKSYKIASYIKASGLGPVSMVGYDLLDSNVEYLKSGIIKFLINQRPEEQTYKAVKKLFEFLSLNKIPDKMEYLPVDIVTSENVDYFTTILS
jgi:LacI family transcriptional regulator